MISNIALLSLPLLAAGAQHGHNHNHARAHDKILEQRSAAVGIVTCTDTVYVTITVEPTDSSVMQSNTPVAQLTPTSSAPVVPQTSVPTKSQSGASQPPSKETAPMGKPVNDGGNGFQTLQPIANSAMVKNSCAYPIYIWSAGHTSCDGEATQGERVDPNGTYVEKLRKCTDGGVSLKISKTTDASKPMQFEYAIWPTQQDTVSYDISYLDCMKNNVGEKDLSQCPGHDGGIQAMGGGDNAPAYKCPANLWCDKESYVVAEFDYKPGAPVGACKVEKGVAFELCAGSG